MKVIFGKYEESMEEIIRVCPDLKIYIKGKEVQDNGPVAQALREFMIRTMKGQNVNHSSFQREN